MRKFVWLIGIIALLWAGYWALGTLAIRNGLTQAIATATTQGKTASFDAIETAGFPLTFNVTLRRLDLGDPTTGQRWQTPAVQLRAATWRPWHLDLRLAEDHVITLPDQELSLTAGAITASITSAPDADLPLTQLTAALIAPVLRSTLGWEFTADVASLAVARAPGTTASYDIAFDAFALRPDPTFITLSGLADVIDNIAARATVTLTAPLDRHAGDARPTLTALTLKNATATWGALLIDATGSIAPDAAGFAEGRFDITLRGWRSLIPALVATGAITPEFAPSIENLLAAMAREGGDPEILLLPLIFANGRTTFGPLPLGPAPMLAASPLN